MSYVPSFIISLEMAFELKRMDLLWEYYVLSKIIGEFKRMGYKYEVKLESGNKQSETKKYVERDSLSLDFSNGKQDAKVSYQREIKAKFEVDAGKTKTLIPDFLIEGEKWIEGKKRIEVEKRIVIDAKFMDKENVPTGDLSKYLIRYRSEAPETGNKVSNAVIAACLKEPPKEQNELKGKVLSFTHMFKEDENYKKINSLEKMLELAWDKSNIDIGKYNQLMGYIEIELP